MGLKELVAAALIAISPVSPSVFAQDTKEQRENLDKMVQEAEKLYKEKKYDKAISLLLEEEKEKSSLAVDLLLAKIYTERNALATIQNRSDHRLAVPRWERVLKDNSNPEYDKHLFTCRESAAQESFDGAQLLWNYRTSKKAREEAAQFGITNEKLAREQALKVYQDAIKYAEHIVKAKPDNENAWRCIGVSYGRLGEWDKSIEAYRNFIMLKPDEQEAYTALVLLYDSKKEIGAVMNELELLKNVKPEVKSEKLAEAVFAAIDEMKKMGRKPAFKSESPEDAKKAVELFYMTADALWSREMKKEKIVDRNFVHPMNAVFLAGTLDYQVSATDEQRETALQRLEKEYGKINTGMDNALYKLAQQYYLVVIQNKRIIVDNAEKFYNVLKERVKK